MPRPQLFTAAAAFALHGPIVKGATRLGGTNQNTRLGETGLVARIPHRSTGSSSECRMKALGIGLCALILTGLLAVPHEDVRQAAAGEIPVTPEPGAENPAMGPRNSDTGQDDAEADTPDGSFGSGAGSRGAAPGEVPAKSGTGDTLDPQ